MEFWELVAYQQYYVCLISQLIELHITLENSYNGGRKEVEYERRVICTKCKGTGSANPDAKTICNKCDGTGRRLIVQRHGPMIMQTQTTCDECNGEGKIIKDKCKECKGKMVKHIKRKIGIDIDKGVPDGHRYTMAGEGDEEPDIETGDLIIEIFLDKHKDFIRKGADLVYKCEISLLEALTGVKIAITHLDGRRILIYTQPGEIIQPQTLKTVEELGMPFFNSPFRFGNLYIDFQIAFPDKLTDEQSQKITEILNNERINGKGKEFYNNNFNLDYKIWFEGEWLYGLGDDVVVRLYLLAHVVVLVFQYKGGSAFSVLAVDEVHA